MIHYIIPAKADSRRCRDKNHRIFADEQTLTCIAVKAAYLLPRGDVTLAGGRPEFDYKIERERYRALRVIDCPKLESGDLAQIWGSALTKICPSPESISVLLEPSSFPRNINRIAEAINKFVRCRRFAQPTIIAVKLRERYGLSAHVFVPTGEVYVGHCKDILEGSVFDGDFEYMHSDSVNIETEAQFEEAKGRMEEWTRQL